MTTIPHNPTEGVYPATPDYVHALEVRQPNRILYVAGTMGLDAQGTPAPTLEGQLDLIWSNIRTILRSAGMSVDNIVRITSYLRDAAYAERGERQQHRRTLARFRRDGCRRAARGWRRLGQRHGRGRRRRLFHVNRQRRFGGRFTRQIGE